MSNLTVTFMGDVHGCWGDLQDRINENENTDIIIQVGDFGIIPTLGSFPPEMGFSKPLFFVDGNHEDHLLLQKHVEEKDLEIVKNVRYVPRATQMKLGNTTINFMGGAQSVYRPNRKQYIDWWAEEVPTQKEFEKFANLSSADIVVTHNAPTSVVENIANYTITDPTNHNFETIFRSMKQKPEIWFFGHFHIDFDKVIDGTRFVCIPCVHAHEFWKNKIRYPIEESKGYTLNL